MLQLTRTTRFMLAVGLMMALLAGACGSDAADSTSSTSTTSAAVTSTTAEAADAASASGDDNAAQSDDAMDDGDSSDGSASTVAANGNGDGDGATLPTTEAPSDEPDTDSTPSDAELVAELQTILPFFGVTDIDGVSECVQDEAANAGLALNEVADSSAFIVALLRCSPDEVRGNMAEAFAELDSSSLAATPEQINCGIEAVIQLLTDLPLESADEVLDSEDAPREFVDGLVDDCGISESDALFLLSEA